MSLFLLVCKAAAAKRTVRTFLIYLSFREWPLDVCRGVSNLLLVISSSSSSSSSSNCTDRAEFPDSLSLSLSYISPVSFFWYIACVRKELIYVRLFCRANTSTFMCRSSSENFTHEFVVASPAVPGMSCWYFWTVYEMGGKWPYSCCFVGFCFPDLCSETALSILV